VFPITTTINSYAQQCKYRVYVFADAHDDKIAVAGAAYLAFKKAGIELNEEAFRLAKLDPERVSEAAGECIPPRRKQDVHRGR